MSDVVIVKYNDQSRNWSEDPEINRLFLRNVLDAMADSLKARGHLFLNEILDELGLPRTSQGQLVGWLYSSEPGVRYWEMRIEEDDITLEFFTQGDIHDKIEQ